MRYEKSDVRTWLKEKKTGIIYVIIPGQGDNWKSSGKTERDEAIEWALIQARGGFSEDSTVTEFTRDFFKPEKCAYVSSRNDDRFIRTKKHWHELRTILVDYILPTWGPYKMADVLPGAFHEWLKNLRSTKFPDQVLSQARRAKVLFTVCVIWDWAVFQGVLEQNTLKTVPRIVPAGTKRRAFRASERAKMFPPDLATVWPHGSNVVSILKPAWGVAALINDEGLRPQETLALYWEDYRADRKAFIVSRAINDEGEGGLKTSTHGIAKRAVKVSDRLAKILEAGKGLKGPIFTQKPWTDKAGMVHVDFLRVDTFGKIFCKTLDQLVDDVDEEGKKVQRPLVDRQGRTLYCLRHATNTRKVTEALKKVQDTMGHTTDEMTANYDDPEDEDLLDRAGA